MAPYAPGDIWPELVVKPSDGTTDIAAAHRTIGYRLRSFAIPAGNSHYVEAAGIKEGLIFEGSAMQENTFDPKVTPLSPAKVKITRILRAIGQTQRYKRLAAMQG